MTETWSCGSLEGMISSVLSACIVRVCRTAILLHVLYYTASQSDLLPIPACQTFMEENETATKVIVMVGDSQ